MPALPSRPSTTIARRCAASCTDRTLHRFCQAFTPSAQQIEGSHSRPLPRCSALRLQLSPGGCLVCYRRILSVPARSGGGRLTERIPAIPPRLRERVKVPLLRHSTAAPDQAAQGGKASFDDLGGSSEQRLWHHLASDGFF